MRCFYDLHMHSCLSPCGDADMTPYNLVNMAAIKELNVIALTDHNTCGNCESAMKAGIEAGVMVIPGMELCVSEEAHIVCLFPDLESAMSFDKYVYDRMPDIKNKEEIFGEQLLMDSEDNILGKKNKLLLTAADISISDVSELIDGYGGVCFPAHIDRDSYSILSVLGDFPSDLNFTAAEITSKADRKTLFKEYPILSEIFILTDSDAHYLENISEPVYTMELSKMSPGGVIDLIRRGGLSGPSG